MTGFKDRLKDALSDFVEFDESAPAPDDAHPPGMKERAPARVVVDPAAAAAPDPSLTDPEMLATLQQAVARSTQPAYDQFLALYEAMDSVPDERLRYDIALKALQASHHLGPDAVLASVEDRIRLLDVERTKFEQALAAETERSITGTNRQIATVADAIKAKQAEILELEARHARLHESAKVAQADLDLSRATFVSAFSSVQSALDADRARISTHLAGGK